MVSVSVLLIGSSNLLYWKCSSSSRGYLSSLAVLMSFCSMSYEFVLAKSVSFFTGMPVVWGPISIGTYLLGMGVGSLLYVRKRQAFLQDFEWVELSLAVIGGGSILLLYYWHIYYRIYIYDANIPSNQLAISFVVYFGAGAMLLVFAIGMLTGLELPYLFDLRKESKIKVTVPKLLFYYQLGVLGSVVFVYYFIMRQLDPIQSAVWVGVLNLGLFVFLDTDNGGRKAMIGMVKMNKETSVDCWRERCIQLF